MIRIRQSDKKTGWMGSQHSMVRNGKGPRWKLKYLSCVGMYDALEIWGICNVLKTTKFETLFALGICSGCIWNLANVWRPKMNDPKIVDVNLRLRNKRNKYEKMCHVCCEFRWYSVWIARDIPSFQSMFYYFWIVLQIYSAIFHFCCVHLFT